MGADNSTIKKIFQIETQTLEGFTKNSCNAEGLNISEKTCDALVKSLGRGKSAFITENEERLLSKVGFSERNLTILSGDYGDAASVARNAWLSKQLLNASSRDGLSADQKLDILNELGEMPPTRDSVFAVANMHLDQDLKYEADRILRSMDRTAVKKIIAKAVKDKNEVVRQRADMVIYVLTQKSDPTQSASSSKPFAGRILDNMIVLHEAYGVPEILPRAHALVWAKQFTAINDAAQRLINNPTAAAVDLVNIEDAVRKMGRAAGLTSRTDWVLQKLRLASGLAVRIDNTTNNEISFYVSKTASFFSKNAVDSAKQTAALVASRVIEAARDGVISLAKTLRADSPEVRVFFTTEANFGSKAERDTAAIAGEALSTRLRSRTLLERAGGLVQRASSSHLVLSGFRFAQAVHGVMMIKSVLDLYQTWNVPRQTNVDRGLNVIGTGFSVSAGIYGLKGLFTRGLGNIALKRAGTLGAAFGVVSGVKDLYDDCIRDSNKTSGSEKGWSVAETLGAGAALAGAIMLTGGMAAVPLTLAFGGSVLAMFAEYEHESAKNKRLGIKS